MTRFAPAELVPYLRDVHDHFVRVGDLAGGYPYALGLTSAVATGAALGFRRKRWL